MPEPEFWQRPSSWLSRLLAPVGALYGAIAESRMRKPGAGVGIPVLCVGNYTTGGAGKTPAVLALVALLRRMGERPVVVSRGYGGRLRGPVPVHAQRHTARDVGDEPMMMAASVPVIVARDRLAGARLAREDGASVVVLDDGFQNPALRKHASLIVIDGARGLGNGLVFPAGPLRAPLAAQFAQTDLLIVIGADHGADDIARQLAGRGKPVLRAQFAPSPQVVKSLRKRRVLAFAGIGDPARFFATLAAHGIEVAEARAFADHRPYSVADIASLKRAARRRNLVLVTTEKDMARIRTDARLAPHAEEIASFPVTLRFNDEAALRGFIAERLAIARASQDEDVSDDG